MADDGRSQQAHETAAALDPDEARHLLPLEPGIGMGNNGEEPVGSYALRMEQIDRPPTVRRLSEIHVPCECGMPLIGHEATLVTDSGGFSFHFEGICLRCGIQRAIYLSPPVEEDAEAERERRTRDEIEALVSQVNTLRKGGAAA